MTEQAVRKARIRSLTIWKDNKIYISTSNDIGYYSANATGSLTYQSLLTDWSFEEKQFGVIWSIPVESSPIRYCRPH